MKKPINFSPDAGSSNGGHDAGYSLDDLGLTNDDLPGAKTTSDDADKGNGGSGETEEAKSARLKAEGEAAVKATADLETAKKFGGVKLDEQGNALDAAGKVVKTATQILEESKATAEAVEIDGVSYQLNEKGEAVDKDGKVFKTKAELDAMEEEEIPLVEEIQQKVGVQILGEDGKPKKYEDTTEGLIEYANDLSVEKARVQLDKFFETHPDIHEFAKFKAKGGTTADYFTRQQQSWANKPFDEKNDAHLHDAIVAELVEKGMPKEQAETTAKIYKDTDKIKEYGKAAHTRLIEGEKARVAEENRLHEERVKADESKVVQHWNSVKDIITKGTLHNIVIPESDREGFYSFLAVNADGKGHSQRQIKYSTMTAQQQLEIDYLIYKSTEKGLNLSNLITAAAKSSNAQTLRKRVAKAQSGAGGGHSIDTGKYKPNNVDITLDDVI